MPDYNVNVGTCKYCGDAHSADACRYRVDAQQSLVEERTAEEQRIARRCQNCGDIHNAPDDCRYPKPAEYKPQERVEVAPKVERSRYITAEVKSVVWQRDDGKCTECGSRDHLHFDHEVPYSLGGSSEAENVRLLCRACNLKKRDKIM